ncbi:MAG: hypothetical protein Kow0062_01880 [Acidobacteriota bacterium]
MKTQTATLILALAALGLAAGPALADKGRGRGHRDRDDHHYYEDRYEYRGGERLHRVAERLDRSAERLEDAARRASRGIHPRDRHAVRYAADRFEDAARDFRRAVHRRSWDTTVLARRLARAEASFRELLDVTRYARRTRGLAAALHEADEALARAEAVVYRRAEYRPRRPWYRGGVAVYPRRYPRGADIAVRGELYLPNLRIGVVFRDDD